MKNHFFTLVLFLFSFTAIFAQETENEEERIINYQLGLGFDQEMAGFHFLMEFENQKLENASYFFKIQSIHYIMNLSNAALSKDIPGNGAAFSIGQRTYTSKNKKLHGFFYASHLKYAYAKFDDDLFRGTYSYISFLSSEIGYKFGIGKSKKFSIELHAGLEWVIEIAGSGDVNNKAFDNWKWGLGLSVGYSF